MKIGDRVKYTKSQVKFWGEDSNRTGTVTGLLGKGLVMVWVKWDDGCKKLHFISKLEII